MPDTQWLTVEEAARRLRIGRTLAYQLTRTYLRTSGREGLCCVQLGRVIRVPSAAIDALAGNRP